MSVCSLEFHFFAFSSKNTRRNCTNIARIQLLVVLLFEIITAQVITLGQQQLCFNSNNDTHTKQVWFQYVKQLTLKYLQNVKHTLVVRSILFLLHQVSTTFVRYRAIYNHNAWAEMTKATGRISKKYDISSFQLVVSTVNGERLTKFWKIWHLKPAKLIAINLTIDEIYFSTAPGGCQRGRMDISHFWSPQNKSSLFQFCGYHSTLSLFLNNRHVAVELCLVQSVLFVVDISFSAIDQHTQQTMHSLSQKESIGDTVSHLSCSTSTKESHFKITVRKDKRIFLRVSQEQQMTFTVYDGPGLWSSVCQQFTIANLTWSNFTCVTSTFQCTVTTMDWISSSFHFINVLHFSLYDYFPRHNIIEGVTTTRFSLPNSQCDMNSCKVTVSVHLLDWADTNLNLNLTVTKLTTTKNYIDGRVCVLSGLLTVETDGNSFKESDVLCTAHSAVNAQSRSFYSFGLRTTVVLFWYKHYSSIQTTLEISTTECEIVHMNLCRMTFTAWFETNMTYQMREYQAQKRNIIETQPIVFLPRVNKNHQQISMKNTKFFFQYFLQKTCVVLDIVEKEINSSEPAKCSYFPPQTNLYLELSNPGYSASFYYEIKGQMRLFPQLGSQKSKLGLARLPEQSSTACFPVTKNGTFCTGNTIRKYHLRCIFKHCLCLEQSTDFDINFQISTLYTLSKFAKINTQNASPDHITFFVEFTPHSSSWATMKIRQNEFSEIFSQTVSPIEIQYFLNESIQEKSRESQEVTGLSLLLETYNKMKHCTNQSLSMNLTSNLGNFKTESVVWNLDIYLNVFTPTVFSVYGTIQEIDISPTFAVPNCSLQNNMITLSLFTNKFFKCMFLSQLKRTFCSKNYKNKNKTNDLCMMFAQPQHDRKWLFNIFDSYRINKTYILHHKADLSYFSWKYACQFCHGLSAHLPALIDKSQMDEFVAFVRFSAHVPALQVIYIGLKITNQVQLHWNTGNLVSYHRFVEVNFRINKISNILFEQKQMTEIAPEDFSFVTSFKNQKQLKHHQTRSPNQSCTVMVLVNLADPFWVQISCFKHHLKYTICVQNKQLTNNSTYNAAVLLNTSCMPHLIFKNNVCYLFLWHSAFTETKRRFGEICKKRKANEEKIRTLDQFSFLFSAIAPVFPPLLSHKSGKTIVVHSHQKFFNYHTFPIYVLPYSDCIGLHICKSTPQLQVKGQNIFQCDCEMYISHKYFCDGTVDCIFCRKDEARCDNFSNQTKFFLGETKGNFSHSRNTPSQCSLLHYVSKNGSCSMYLYINHVGSSVSKTTCQEETKSIQQSQKKLSSFTSKFVIRYQESYPFKCKQKDQKFFCITDICFYKIDSQGIIIPCRNGDHLEKCKMFECNAKFKCSNSYCILWSYLCDGKWDCSGGDDELQGKCTAMRPCRNLFKCKQTAHTCVHLRNVCDNLVECPHGDDEDICELHGLACPANCSCLLFALMCVNRLQPLTGIFPHVFLSFYDGNWFHFSVMESFIVLFPKISFLLVLGSDVRDVCQLNLKHTLMLEFTFNRLTTLLPKCFQTQPRLKQIKLNNNRITTISSTSFLNLVNLTSVSLSNNPIQRFPGLSINKESLRLLLIENASFTDIQKDGFEKQQISVIKSSDFHICCITPIESFCSAQVPWYVSCFNLLPELSIRVVVLVCSTLLLFLNLVSVILHSVCKVSNKANSVNIVVINFSDMLCGVFLYFIWISDIYFGGFFSLHENDWRSNPVCSAASGIFLWHEILTPVSLLFLSVARFKIVKSPLTTKVKHKPFVLRYFAIISGISFLLSLSFSLFLKFAEGMLPLSLCLPCIDPLKSSVLIKTLTLLVMISKIITAISMLLIYVCLLRQIHLSQIRTCTANQHKHKNRCLLIQIIVATVSNFVCWFPSSIVFLSALFLSRYPIQIIFWTVAGIIPIHPIVSPVVFVVVMTRKFLSG